MEILLVSFLAVVSANLVLKVKSAVDGKFLDQKGNFVPFKELKKDLFAEFELGEGKAGAIKIVDDQERLLSADENSLKWTPDDSYETRWTFLPLDTSEGILSNQKGKCLLREGEKIALGDCPDDLAAMGSKKYHFSMLLDATDESIKQASLILKTHEKHVKELEKNDPEAPRKSEKKEDSATGAEDPPIGIISPAEDENTEKGRYNKKQFKKDSNKIGKSSFHGVPENFYADSSDLSEFEPRKRRRPYQEYGSSDYQRPFREREIEFLHEVHPEEGDSRFLHERVPVYYDEVSFGQNSKRALPWLVRDEPLSYESASDQNMPHFVRIKSKEPSENLNGLIRGLKEGKVDKSNGFPVDAAVVVQKSPLKFSEAGSVPGNWNQSNAKQTINEIKDTVESLKTKIESFMH